MIQNVRRHTEKKENHNHSTHSLHESLYPKQAFQAGSITAIDPNSNITLSKFVSMCK